MASIKSNPFSTFLDNVDPGPSRKTLDFESAGRQALDWVKGQQPDKRALTINDVLKTLAAAHKPMTMLDFVKESGVDVDACVSVLNSAVSAGLVESSPGAEGLQFAITGVGLKVAALSP